MELNDKIDLLRDLFTQRDDARHELERIENEIADMLGGKASTPAKQRKTGGRPSVKREEPAATGKGVKECCGSKGPRHFKTCPIGSKNFTGNKTKNRGEHRNGPRPADEIDVSDPLAKFPVSHPPVSEEDYIEAKRLRDDWADSTQSIANSTGIDEAQVKRIIRCDSYEQYLGQ